MFQDIETFNKMIFSLMQITNLTGCKLFTDYSKRKIDIFCNIQMLCKHVKVKSPSTDLLYSGRLRLGEGGFIHFFFWGGARVRIFWGEEQGRDKFSRGEATASDLPFLPCTNSVETFMFFIVLCINFPDLSSPCSASKPVGTKQE